jgi:Uma2 family endonuclease
MIALASKPSASEPLASAEQRVLLHGVSWGAYLVLRESLDQRGSHAHLTYLEGALEIMSPSEDHEESKDILRRLVEAYAQSAGIALSGFGSATYREEAAQRGLEPDQCYMVGRRKRVPDLAFEVVISSPLLDKLDVYAGLGVPEVWVLRRGKLAVHILGKRGYDVKNQSHAFPNLDLELLVSFVRLGKVHSTLVDEFMAALRGSKKSKRPRRPAKK